MQPPIFIVGAPRSGTTLLQYMLRSHPDISLPTGESHFIVPLLKHAHEYGDLSQLENIRRVLARMYQQSANFLETDLHGLKFEIDKLAETFHQEGRHTMPAIISGLFEKNAAGEGASIWGDKTPYYVLHMPLLRQHFPGCRFIHLIRDGRDCALSMFQRRHDFGVYNTFFAAKYWEIYVEIGRQTGKGLGIKIYHEIRYEDLLERPEATMRDLCAFLNVQFHDSLINFKKSGEAGKTPLLQKPLQRDNRQKWRSRMTPRQILLFERAVGPTLQDCGYPLTTDATPLPLPVRAFWHLHNRLAHQYYRLRGATR
ncbi:sulfotransferase family protein [Methylomarinovum tepidoasis]|nr:sulfotransferase [Methylomarinovum sp. IN45]